MPEKLNLLMNNRTNVRIINKDVVVKKKSKSVHKHRSTDQGTLLYPENAEQKNRFEDCPLSPLEGNKSRVDFINSLVDKVNLKIFDELF